MKATALQLRQSLGKILKQLQKHGEPIIIEKSRKTVAVLISPEQFQERFIDYSDEDKRRQLFDAFRQHRVKPARDTLTVLRGLRYGKRH